MKCFLIIFLCLITCTIAVEIFLAKQNEIWRCPEDSRNRCVYIPVSDLKSVADIDYDPSDGYLYWADKEHKTISRARLDGTEQKVLFSDVRSFGFRLEPVSKVLFWTDYHKDSINSGQADGSNRRQLITDDLSTPASIVLDKTSKPPMMYFTDADKGRIEKADWDGKGRQIVVNTDLEYPYSLALDTTRNLIYWTDKEKSRLDVAKCDGTDRKKLHMVSYVYSSIDLFGDHLYMTDISKGTVERYNRIQDNSTEIIQSLMMDIHGIKAVVNGLKKEKGPLFIGGDPNVHVLDLNVPRDFGRTFTNLPSGKSQSVDFNPRDEQLYWSDAVHKAIYRSNMSVISPEQFIAPSDGSNPGDIAVSWQTDELFWADEQGGYIERITLNGTGRTTIIRNLTTPTGVAVDMTNRLIYWVDQSRAMIQRATYNGTNIKTLVEGLGKPGDIELDVTNQLLYWTDTERRIIGVAGIDGTNAETLIGDLEAASLSILGDDLFWSDKSYKNVSRINRFNPHGGIEVIYTGNSNPVRCVRVISKLADTYPTIARNSMTSSTSTTPTTPTNPMNWFNNTTLIVVLGVVVIGIAVIISVTVIKIYRRKERIHGSNETRQPLPDTDQYLTTSFIIPPNQTQQCHSPNPDYEKIDSLNPYLEIDL